MHVWEKRKEEWDGRRDGDRRAWFKLIPSLQFQQDLATSFLDFLLRSSQWGSEAEINGKRTVSFSVPHTHSHSSWHQFAFDWENAAVEHKLITISKRPLCVSLIGVSVSAPWFQYIWTAPSGLGLQTGVRLWTEREWNTHSGLMSERWWRWTGTCFAVLLRSSMSRERGFERVFK